MNRHLQGKRNQNVAQTPSQTPPGRDNQPSPFAGKTAETLVDAAAVAAYLGVDRSFVYENAAKLGARRLGAGPKARLRFSLADVDGWLTSCSEGRWSPPAATGMVERKRPRRRASSLGSGVELLPVRGEQAA